MNQKSFATHTLGCKLNFSETSTIARQLQNLGFVKQDDNTNASIHVINTCTVTKQAEKKARQLITRLHRNNPNSKIIVTGCYAQLRPEELASIDGVSWVIGNNEKFDVQEYLNPKKQDDINNIKVSQYKDLIEYHPAYSLDDRTRTFLKIQDGCDYFCSYCAIPLARGKSRSATIEEVVVECKKIIDCGIREIVLTGVNIGDFGNQGQSNLLTLLKELSQFKNVRFRISSIEPDLLSDEMIDYIANSKHIAPHLHIPFQHGTSELLQAMNRRYNTFLLSSRVSLIKQKIPFASIGADMIVGFPGESENLFQQSYSFLNSLDLSYLHVFPYSERPKTKALLMDNKISESDKSTRVKLLLELSDQKKKSFFIKNDGRCEKVIIEQKNKDGFYTGVTGNYIPIISTIETLTVGTLLEGKLEYIDGKDYMNFIIKNK